MPEPQADEALIQTAATTVGTSDLNDMTENVFGIKLPRVLGHEAAGAVAAVGDEVRGVQIGQRVTAHPVISCGRCESCKRGLKR